MSDYRAPSPPGRMGVAAEPAAIGTYLVELDAWVRGRRLELDELDAAALAGDRGGAVAGDMMLSLALWKAVADRYQLINATLDGGRVLLTERERISSLIWGRLDGAGDLPGGLAVSVPEACRLSDALAGQLRTSPVPGAGSRRGGRPDQGAAGPARAAAGPGRLWSRPARAPRTNGCWPTWTGA